MTITSTETSTTTSTTLPLSLFATGRPALSGTATFDRLILDECCWIDVCHGAVTGSDTLFAEMESMLDWHRRQRLMYGTWYDEPRLTATETTPGYRLPAVVDDVRTMLSTHYGRSFEGLFCNFYRDGADGVAWHADRIGRTDLDPLVGIISLGGPRTFALRPFGAGAATRLCLYSGDIVVMGGAMQHHWEHSIPKASGAAPRISLTMRAGGPPFSVRVGD